MRIHDIVPDPEVLLALEPEEIAGVVLQYLNSLRPDEDGQLNRYNFTLVHTVQDYPQSYHYRLQQALTEGWVWLEREGLVAPKPNTQENWVFITRRGKSLQTAQDVAAYSRANVLPKEMLHPVIASKVWSTFLRGDYDTAVFQAFKEVEVAVREAASLPAELVGTDLMRKAFDQQAGPLRDSSAPKAEREALAHLFAGAIGCYKNPQSHRTVTMGAEESTEALVLASQLLRITDSRRTAVRGGA